MSKKLFCVVAGPRLGGKTTLAGTCPGRTLLLQAAVLESGSRSAQVLAKRRGNELVVETFADLLTLRNRIETLRDEAYDNVYIDGLSAITDMKFSETAIQTIARKNIWDAYLKLGTDVSDLLLKLKELTYGDNAKNVFVTCALKVKSEGNSQDVELESKGKMAVTSITKLGEAVVTITQLNTEHGPRRTMITRTFDNWPGRVDGVLDDDNEGFYEPDLGIVLEMTAAA